MLADRVNESPTMAAKSQWASAALSSMADKVFWGVGGLTAYTEFLLDFHS